MTTLADPNAGARHPMHGVGPAVALAAVAALIGLAVARFNPAASPLLVAIILGFLARSFGLVTEPVVRGLPFVSRRLLRAGIVLLGAQLVLTEILALGVGMLGVIGAVVGGGLLVTLGVGKVLGIPPNQRLLVACGFSICGAAAVAAVDDVVRAEEEDVAAAVGLVVLFGTAMILFVPVMAALLGLGDSTAGRWAGASIHEVAQVVVVGGSLGSAALAAAVVVKLGRVLMLGPVVAVVGFSQRRRVGSRLHFRQPLVPAFIWGFLLLSVTRTAGVISPDLLELLKVVQVLLLAMAMFGLGCGVDLGVMRRMGWRPLALGAVSTVAVATIALTGVLLVR